MRAAYLDRRNQMTNLLNHSESCMDMFSAGAPVRMISGSLGRQYGGNGSAPASVTRLPDFRAALAALSPAGPAPTIRISAFGSYGWSGEAVPGLVERLKALKMDVFEEGFRCRFIPSESELSDAFEFGARFAHEIG